MTVTPWRYSCPECGAHSLHPRVSGGYRCEVCETVVKRRYDKKRGVLVA